MDNINELYRRIRSLICDNNNVYLESALLAENIYHTLIKKSPEICELTKGQARSRRDSSLQILK